MATRAAAMAIVTVFVLSGCGGHEDHNSPAPNAGGHDMGRDAASDEADFTFGRPGDPADATTTIEVAATDELAFDPSSIDVEAGEIVTFVVTNSGKLPHEFVLGDEDSQHSESGDMSEHGSNAVALSAGATEELTWMFTEAGTVEFACHVDDHYEGGMRGKIRVT